RVGSPVVFRGEFEGQVWEDKGTVLIWESPARVAYSYYSGTCGLDDRPENYATVSYELGEAEGGTVLTVRQQGYPSEESQKSSAAGWNGVLAQIKALAEAGKQCLTGHSIPTHIQSPAIDGQSRN